MATGTTTLYFKNKDGSTSTMGVASSDTAMLQYWQQQGWTPTAPAASTATNPPASQTGGTAGTAGTQTQPSASGSLPQQNGKYYVMQSRPGTTPTTTLTNGVGAYMAQSGNGSTVVSAYNTLAEALAANPGKQFTGQYLDSERQPGGAKAKDDAVLTLISKPVWNDGDLANWNYATGGAAKPTSVTVQAGGSTGATGPAPVYGPPAPTGTTGPSQVTGATGATGPSNSQMPQGTQTVGLTGGRFGFVTFGNDPTPGDPNTSGGAGNVWLFDSVDKTYHPFSSMNEARAFANWAGVPPTEFDAHVTVVADPTNPPSAFQGVFLPMSYAPKAAADGQYAVPKYDQAPGALQTYGKMTDATAAQTSILRVAKFADQMAKAGLISQDTWTKLTDVSGQYVARFAYAGTYGGYSLSDIYRQMKIDELAKTDQKYANMKAIDPAMSKEQFSKTQAFSDSSQDAKLAIPYQVFQAALQKNGLRTNLDEQTANTLLQQPLYQVSDDIFKVLVPVIDYNDPKTRDEVAKIQAGYYDVMMAMANAKTEQQQQVAQQNFQAYKEKLWKDFGIQTGNDAQSVWNTISQLGASARNSGIGNSGIAQEVQDKALRERRIADDNLRKSNLTTEEQTYVKYLRDNGTPADVKSFIAKVGATKAMTYGLIPSQQLKEAMDPLNLRQAYPDLTDQQLALIRSQVLDENGNFVSKAVSDVSKENTATSTSKTAAQQAIYQNQNNEAVKKAYAPFTSSTTYLGTAADIPSQYGAKQDASATPPSTTAIDMPSNLTSKPVEVSNAAGSAGDTPMTIYYNGDKAQGQTVTNKDYNDYWSKVGGWKTSST